MRRRGQMRQPKVLAATREARRRLGPHVAEVAFSRPIRNPGRRGHTFTATHVLPIRRLNPAEYAKWAGLPASAQLTIGSKKGSKRRGERLPYNITPARLREATLQYRNLQVGRSGGGTVIGGLGYWHDDKGKVIREKSASVIIYHDPDIETWRKFKAHITKISEHLTELLVQDSIIVVFEKGGKTVERGSAEWTPGKDRPVKIRRRPRPRANAAPRRSFTTARRP